MATALVPRLWRNRTPIRRHDPFGALDTEFDSLLRGFLGDWPMATVATSGGHYVPSVNVRETEEAVELSAELPGIDHDDLSIELTPEGDGVVLRGEKKVEHSEEDAGHRRFERTFGTFERHIALPAVVDEKGTEAVLKDGVLTLTMPKRSPEPARRIKIKAK